MTCQSPKPSGGSLDQGVDPNYRDPQANQWNLTVERHLGGSDNLRVSYVGMPSYRLGAALKSMEECSVGR